MASLTWQFTVEDQIADSKEKPYLLCSSTQAVANYFPFESETRKNSYSNAQQFINSFAYGLQATNDIVIQALNNQTPQTYELEPIDSVSWAQISLNPIKRYLPGGGVEFTFPTITGRDGYHKYTLQTTYNNDLYDIPNNYPTNFYLEEDNLLEESTHSITETEVEFDFPSYIFFSVKNVTQFMYQDDNEAIRIPLCTITGITSRGIEETENLTVYYNGVYRTKLRYKRITSIYFTSNEGFPEETVISFTNNPYLYSKEPVNDYRYRETLPSSLIPRECWWSFENLEDTTRGDILNLQHYLAANGEEFANGVVELTSLRSVELFNNSGEPIEILGIAPLPTSDLSIYVLGNPKNNYSNDYRLYKLTKEQEYPPQSWMNLLRTDSPNFVIDLDIEDFTTFVPIGGKEITLFPFSKSLAPFAHRTRISYFQEEEGEIVQYYLNQAGTIVAADDAWIINLTPLGTFTKYTVPFTITNSGRYAFRIETQHTEGTITQRTKLYNQLVQTPLVEYKIPQLDGTPTDIFIDGNGILNLIDSQLKSYKVHFVWNYAIVDFARNLVISTNPEINYLDATYATN